MATYTDNYNLIKPTYAETADIVPLNNNFEKIDEVMHASQTSLAPAYDQTASYQPGDVVMYELNMYKCIGATSGAWDPSKWTRTTAAETGGGGSVDLDIYGEASGTAEASFSDGAEASLVECEIGIEPTQDLHGYSKPWAGGAGKNKYTGSPSFDGYSNINNWTLDSETYNGHEVIYKSSAWNGVYKLINLPTGTYTFSVSAKASVNTTAYIYTVKTGETTATVTPISEIKNITTEWTKYTITFDVTTAGTVALSIGNSSNSTLYISEYQLESGNTATTYEPYSNICPISGHTDVTVTVASTSGASGDDTTVSLGRTVYGGSLDVTTGELTVTWDNIPSYAGETLTGEWLSSLDEYDALGTPTTGAQVAYELATPQTFTLSKEQIQTLLGQNYVRHDGGGTISLVYVKGYAPIKPNPADAEIPLTGLEINGEKFSISVIPKTTELWSNNSGFGVGSYPLNDDINNYDFIEIYYGVYSEYNDITDSKIVSVDAFNYLHNLNKKMILTGYENRVVYCDMYNSTLSITTANSNTILRVVGIKF